MAYVKKEIPIIKKEPTISELLGVGIPSGITTSKFSSILKTYAEYTQKPGLMKLANFEESSENFPLMGIEIEVENIAKPLPLPEFWQEHQENSLRDHGREFVSIPLRDPQVAPALLVLFELFRTFVSDKQKFSWRTSTHLHIGVGHYSLSELKRILLLYMIFEKVLFNWIGAYRKSSTFCVPWYESSLVDTLQPFFATQATKDAEFKKYFSGFSAHWPKYSALNLMRLRDLGTLEFRHLEGTRDPKKILNWSLVIKYLVVRAVEVSDKELFSILERLNTTSNYHALAKQVFPDSLINFLKMKFEPENFSECVTFAKECLLPPCKTKQEPQASSMYMAFKKQKQKEMNDRKKKQIQNEYVQNGAASLIEGALTNGDPIALLIPDG